MPSINYFIREAFRGLKANKATAAGSIITIFLSLFLIGIFVFANTIINNVTNAVEEQVTVTAYISDDASADESIYMPVMDEIKGLSGVEKVTFTSKDQALEDFKTTMKSDDIIDQLDGTNPLPASFNITLADPQNVDKIANDIQKMDSFIDICDSPDNPQSSVKYGQKTVKRLFSMTDTIRVIGTLIVLMLIFVAFIFMNNTIKLAISNREQEIAIQRLVGASNGFIRGPFLTEGILQAAFGALLAIIFLEIISTFVMPIFAGNMAWLPLELSLSVRIGTYFMLLCAGILIGLVSSAFAMRKYLKV